MRLRTVVSDPFRRNEPPPPLLRLTGQHYGLGSAFLLAMTEVDDPRLYPSIFKPADIGRVFNSDSGDPRSGGIGTTVEVAGWSALGEFVERYCAAVFAMDVDPLVASWEEMTRKGLRCVPPEQIPLFLPRQHAQPGWPYAPFRRDTPTAWVEGVSLVDGKPTWVPRQIAMLTAMYAPGEERIAYSTSTGAACGSTLEDALLGGLYEYVERDAVVVSWYSHRPPPEVEIASSDRVREFTETSLPSTRNGRTRARMFDITTDVPIPVLYGLYEDFTGRRLRAHVAAACRLDPEEAGVKTVMELAQGVLYLKLISATQQPETNLANFLDLEKNVHWYGDPQNFRHLEFLNGNSERRKFAQLPGGGRRGSTKEDLRHCVRTLAERGFDPVAIDMTTEDVRGLGLHAVRVFVPGLAMLGVPSAPFLGSKRLLEVPAKIGTADRPLREDELYVKAPHPFP